MYLGLCFAVDSQGRTIWIADAQRAGKRFILRADEKLTAFVELESVICGGQWLAGAIGLGAAPFFIDSSRND